MKRSSERILVSHTGNLPRPADLQALVDDTGNAFVDRLPRAVKEVVERQIAAGIDQVNDGEPSRWNSAADKRWIPVRPEKVAEVAYDQMEGNTVHGQRFRHAVKFVRWRPDRDPRSCTFDQLDAPLNYDLSDVLES